MTTAFDPSNFLKTKTFGLAPANTTLTIEYSYGGGVDDNANSGDITFKAGTTFEIAENNLSPTLVQTSKDSVAFTNPNPATGGGGGESIRDVRENALAYYQAQQRAVTKDDYIVRAYSLPAKYGNVAKVHLVQDDQLNKPTEELDRKVTTQDVENGLTIKQLAARVPNPLAMNMYTLGYDSNNQLTQLSSVVKENLKTYLSQYRLVTDAINIKDAYIIDIAVDFAVLTKVGFNKNDILLRCIDRVKDYFDVTRWQIGQPIIIADIVYELSLVDGVSSVVNPLVNGQRSAEQIVITNKFKPSEGYSGNAFDIPSATINGVIYTALDPSIFQVRFPDTDIKGTVVGDNLGITE